jgi:hypothetical protein
MMELAFQKYHIGSVMNTTNTMRPQNGGLEAPVTVTESVVAD